MEDNRGQGSPLTVREFGSYGDIWLAGAEAVERGKKKATKPLWRERALETDTARSCRLGHGRQSEPRRHP